MSDLQQNTPEWLECRKDHVGASDAPVIMGVSPYLTPYQLWQKKLSLVPELESWILEKGKKLEPIAREKLEDMTGMLFMPVVKFHPSNKWMMASIDAMEISESTIAEIKYTGQEDHAIAIAGKVPDKYFPQLQHQMEVCQLEKMTYFSFNGSEGVVVEVWRDDKYIKGMIAKEEEFFECVMDLVPPALSKRDYREVHDEKWIMLADKWKHISTQMTQLETEQESLKKELIALAENQNTAGAGLKVSKQVRKGNIEYAKIPELKKMDLEAYRKPPTEYWKILSN